MVQHWHRFYCRVFDLYTNMHTAVYILGINNMAYFDIECVASTAVFE